MRRYTQSEITITVREGDRLLVPWRGDAFDPVKASFRAHFSRHGDAVYNGTERAWSMPLSCRYRLWAWLDGTAEPAAVTWTGEPASQGSRTDSSKASGLALVMLVSRSSATPRPCPCALAGERGL